jgi:hypothetical protein
MEINGKCSQNQKKSNVNFTILEAQAIAIAHYAPHPSRIYLI